MSTRHQLLYDDIRSIGDHRKHILLGAGDTEISVGMQGNNLNSLIIDVSFMNIDVLTSKKIIYKLYNELLSVVV